MPEPRGALTAQAIGQRIHVIGGDRLRLSGNMSIRNDVYNPTTGGWSSAADVPDNQTWGAASAALGDRVYLLGGYPGGNAHRVYDSTDDSW